ncbi:hypothetical protein CDD81_7927 [Ophiocordyceps australis]|uniref:Uncharacterized protein n=1 Tax=Ophiocordyceps australis TaxID=1399860 RepID=A0A2C5Y4F0_9HYPO|nr:hypothetical protein CDD81_7927 [Ophiocordyceps australis]
MRLSLLLLLLLYSPTSHVSLSVSLSTAAAIQVPASQLLHVGPVCQRPPGVTHGPPAAIARQQSLRLDTGTRRLKKKRGAAAQRTRRRASGSGNSSTREYKNTPPLDLLPALFLPDSFIILFLLDLLHLPSTTIWSPVLAPAFAIPPHRLVYTYLGLTLLTPLPFLLL